MLMPWDELEDAYAAQFCKGFRAPANPGRMVLNALIIRVPGVNYVGLAEFRLRAFRVRQGPRSQPAPSSAGDPVLLLEAR